MKSHILFPFGIRKPYKMAFILLGDTWFHSKTSIVMSYSSRCQRCRGRLVPPSAATPLVKGAHSNWLWKLSSMTALPETCQNSLKFHLHILWRKLHRKALILKWPYLKFQVIPCKRTEHRCAFLLRLVCAVRHAVTVPFGGALCNDDEVYHLCILLQRMGLWIILTFI